MSASNLPEWAGADVAYRHAYAMLRDMAQRGHVLVVRNGQGKPIRSIPSEEMEDLIAALNAGDEERIKGALICGRTN